MKKKWILQIVLLSLLVVGVSAVLVNDLSNTVSGTVDVESPVTLEVTGNSAGSYDGSTFTALVFGGQSFNISTLTTVHIEGVTGHIGESKIANFNGEGITVTYRVDAYPGYFEIPVCKSGGNAYFYIGDPDETLPKESFTSRTTFDVALDIDPETNLSITTKVILDVNKACDYAPPVFVAD